MTLFAMMKYEPGPCVASVGGDPLDRTVEDTGDGMFRGMMCLRHAG